MGFISCENRTNQITNNLRNVLSKYTAMQ